MKLKNRGNLYLVERVSRDNPACVIVGGFTDYETAENYAEACLQEYIDKGFEDSVVNGDVVFNIALTTYYE